MMVSKASEPQMSDVMEWLLNIKKGKGVRMTAAFGAGQANAAVYQG
jgi:hypothetical protein